MTKEPPSKQLEGLGRVSGEEEEEEEGCSIIRPDLEPNRTALQKHFQSFLHCF